MIQNQQIDDYQTQVPSHEIQMADANSLTWPLQLEPCFVIHTCFNCKEHQWCTRHNQAKYDHFAQNLKQAIALACQIDPKYILVNEFHKSLGSECHVFLGSGRNRLYKPSSHFKNLYFKLE